MGNRSKHDIRQVAKAELSAKALELRKTGLSYREIAPLIGRSTGEACRLVHEAIAEITREHAEDCRDIELQRLDQLWQGLVKNGALEGDPKAVLAAAKLMDLRARYLGLYAPAQVELTGENGGPVKFAPVIMIPPERQDDSADQPTQHQANESNGTSGGLAS
jgi:hypothetical protein